MMKIHSAKKEMLGAFIFAILFLSGSFSFAQNISSQLILPPHPSRQLSDWQSNPQSVLLIVHNTDNAPINVKVSSRIELNGNIVARIKQGMEPIVTLAQGSTTVLCPHILPLNGLEFLGNTSAEAQRSGMLAEGSYQLCVDLTKVGTSSTAPVQTCASFQIVVLTPPVLIQPNNGASIDENNIPNFLWLPPSPLAASKKVRYQLKIVEIIGKQTPNDALKYNHTWIDKTVLLTTTPILPTEIILPTHPGIHSFAWNILAVLDDGPIPSAINTFTITIPEGRPLKDTDCIEIQLLYSDQSEKLEKHKRDCDELRDKLARLERELGEAQAALGDAKARAEQAAKDATDAEKIAAKTQKDLDKSMRNLRSMLPGGFGVDVYHGKFGDRPDKQNNAIGRSGSKAALPNSGGVAVQWGGATGTGQAGVGTILRLGDLFWSAFRDAQSKYQANETAQKNAAAAKAKQAAADKDVSDLQSRIAKLEKEIADLKKQLDDCDKETEALSKARDEAAVAEEKCLKRIHAQRQADEAIADGAKAIADAKSAEAGAAKAIAGAEDASNKRPNTESEKNSVDGAKTTSSDGGKKLTEAEELLKKAREAQEHGDPDEAKRNADEAKKKADEAQGKYQNAERSADHANATASSKPTAEEIKAQEEKDKKDRQQLEEDRKKHEADADLEASIRAAIVNQLAKIGIPPRVGHCLTRNKAAWAAFQKWMHDNKQNVSKSDYEQFEQVGSAIEHIGDLIGEVAKALAGGGTILEGVLNGLGSAGIGWAAGLFYNWAGDAAKAATKRIADNHVVQLIGAQASGPFGVINGAGVSGSSTTSYFYFKDCDPPYKTHVFRISATAGFEYLGTTD